MDSAYGKLSLPFGQALTVLATVVSVSAGWAVADCGVKALGMDHGNPTIEGAEVWFCSDEHLTFAPGGAVAVGDRVRVIPSHVDPTVAYHEHHPRRGRRRGARELARRPAGAGDRDRGPGAPRPGAGRGSRESTPGASHIESTRKPASYSSSSTPRRVNFELISVRRSWPGQR